MENLKTLTITLKKLGNIEKYSSDVVEKLSISELKELIKDSGFL